MPSGPAALPPEAMLSPAPPPGSAGAPPGRRRPARWVVWFASVGVLLIVVGVVGWFVRLPYYTISPGSSLDVNHAITVEGAQVYEPEGEMRLLFVRQRARVNVWRWLQASLDPDIDLFREAEFTGGQSPEEVRVAARAEMAMSQIAAKKVALEAIGYEVPPAGNGVVVLALLPGRPAADVVEQGDVLLDAAGRPIVETSDLGDIVREHRPGDTITLRVRRDGEERDVEVAVASDEQGRPVIGVWVARVYDFPVDVEIDTSRIGGPSAGLAMTLAIIDTLTQGELTGATTVAVTGTIADDGSVGEIGGISQKAVAARAGGASLFLVPACREEAIRRQCERDLRRAIDRAGDDLRVVPVATLDEALRALESAGGDPVPELFANAR